SRGRRNQKECARPTPENRPQSAESPKDRIPRIIPRKFFARGIRGTLCAEFIGIFGCPRSFTELAVSARETQIMPSAIPITEACERINLSRSKFYELLNKREIQSIKIGRRRLVRVADLDRWLESLPSQTPAEAA